MSTETLLSHLQGVKQTGAGRYKALCPAHEDKTPSLSIRELDDGRTLVHCFSGCDVHSVLTAAGLSIEELFPPRDLGHHLKRESRPFPAADILRAIAFEALVVAAAGSILRAGEPMSIHDRERLFLAVSRIQAALDAGGLTNG